ncbi:nitrogen regulation protein NR(I) [Candidatus Magnetaquicoccus inordinatus]|uniref:nitrogen regulation protein NR(I) n=1 Tax=Candidatus Magnetaquicoccus inordinatus TaxID=2496818 RepID=UPI00102AACF4|nr:nitrogen regulation protein NR(I) [Candidatus Magnetaquicoccus inordinatus]
MNNRSPSTAALPGRTILVADDDHAMRYVLEQALGRAGYRVYSFANGKALLDFASETPADLVITDIVMPSGSGLDLLQTLHTRQPELPVIVMTAQSTLSHAVQAFERGAFEYLAKPFDIRRMIDLVAQAMERQQASRPRPATSNEFSRFGGFVGLSQAMQELFRTIGRLANSEMTVLIHGESGTGKELVARAVHDHSPRRQGPFTAINMAAIPANLIESELFGHEKGAFTGAVARHHGHFERAKGGTLFLDEIGDMPMQAQTRLLRVLQGGSFTRVGGTETLKADVRIVAATHQNLPSAIVEGRFREDLFYRLNVVPLYVPSLRSRREDIPLLVDYFLARAAQKLGLPLKRMSQESLAELMAYDWPGNVRELENLIHRLMVLTPQEIIQREHLNLPRVGKMPGAYEVVRDATLSRVESDVAEEVSPENNLLRFLDQFFTSPSWKNCDNLYDQVVNRIEKSLFDRVLLETSGNRVMAARLLGINRNTLRKKIQDLDVNVKR